MDSQIEELRRKIEERIAGIPEKERGKITKAMDFAIEKHSNQRRARGEPYVTHPMEVALILMDAGMDSEAVQAGLLHDTVEDTDATIEEIEREFGSQVANIVKGVTNLDDQTEDEIHHRIMSSSVGDIRVIAVKLADRLHNMRTISAKTEESRRRNALETLDFYVPLAHQLGMRDVEYELADLSMIYLNPEVYRELKVFMDTTKDQDERFLEKMEKIVSEIMDRDGMEYRLFGRRKSIYSIYKKIQRKSVTLDQIYDRVAMRLIVPTEADCYRAKELLEGRFNSLSDRVKDYIKHPRADLYRALHITVVTDDGYCEIQMRSKEMDYVDEYGISDHFTYKGEANLDRTMPRQKYLVDWFHDILDTYQVSGAVMNFRSIFKLNPSLRPEDIYPEVGDPDRVFDSICRALDEQNLNFEIDRIKREALMLFMGEDYPMGVVVTVYGNVVNIRCNLAFGVEKEQYASTLEVLNGINDRLVMGSFRLDSSTGRLTYNYSHIVTSEIDPSEFMYVLMHVVGVAGRFDGDIQKKIMRI